MPAGGTLASQLLALATATAGTDKTIAARIGSLPGLTTADKTSLVNAVNEVRAAALAQVDNTGPASTTKAYSSAKTDSQIAAAVAGLVNGAPGLLDTLGEIAAQLAADESGAASLATTVAGKAAKSANGSDFADIPTVRANLSVYSKAEIGDLSTLDLVGTYNSVLNS